MRAKVQSFAFACGLALVVFSWGAGSAQAQCIVRFQQFRRSHEHG